MKRIMRGKKKEEKKSITGSRIVAEWREEEIMNKKKKELEPMERMM